MNPSAQQQRPRIVPPETSVPRYPSTDVRSHTINMATGARTYQGLKTCNSSSLKKIFNGKYCKIVLKYYQCLYGQCQKI